MPQSPEQETVIEKMEKHLSYYDVLDSIERAALDMRMLRVVTSRVQDPAETLAQIAAEYCIEPDEVVAAQWIAEERLRRHNGGGVL